MYIPRHFAVDDPAARELLASFEVAQLVTATASGPLATLMPWVVDLDDNRLIGHVARANPQWSTPWIGEALVIAQGPNGYVSPSWYASKAEHGKVVPTWNYVVIQVAGELIVHDDQEWTDAAVNLLTDRHEQPRSQPWEVSDAPRDYIEAQLRAIVGIEVRINRIEAAIKMSQNKNDADFEGVVQGFMEDGHEALAEFLSRERP